MPNQDWLDIEHMTKHIMDIRNWSGLVSICHDSELITIKGDEGTGYYVCSECGQPCDVKGKNQ